MIVSACDPSGCVALEPQPLVRDLEEELGHDGLQPCSEGGIGTGPSSPAVLTRAGRAGPLRLQAAQVALRPGAGRLGLRLGDGGMTLGAGHAAAWGVVAAVPCDALPCQPAGQGQRHNSRRRPNDRASHASSSLWPEAQNAGRLSQNCVAAEPGLS